MLFSEIKSNKKNQQGLIDVVNNHMIPNAQLFYGPNRSEKLLTALAYIQYIFCEDKRRHIGENNVAEKKAYW